MDIFIGVIVIVSSFLFTYFTVVWALENADKLIKRFRSKKNAKTSSEMQEFAKQKRLQDQSKILKHIYADIKHLAQNGTNSLILGPTNSSYGYISKAPEIFEDLKKNGFKIKTYTSDGDVYYRITWKQ